LRSARLLPAPVAAVALWDTVGAYGIPEFNLQHQAIDAFQFADTRLSDNVHHGGTPSQRGNFTPTLWNPDPPRIVQVLFPGDQWRWRRLSDEAERAVGLRPGVAGPRIRQAWRSNQRSRDPGSRRRARHRPSGVVEPAVAEAAVWPEIPQCPNLCRK